MERREKNSCPLEVSRGEVAHHRHHRLPHQFKARTRPGYQDERLIISLQPEGQSLVASTPATVSQSLDMDSKQAS